MNISLGDYLDKVKDPSAVAGTDCLAWILDCIRGEKWASTSIHCFLLDCGCMWPTASSSYFCESPAMMNESQTVTRMGPFSFKLLLSVNFIIAIRKTSMIVT